MKGPRAVRAKLRVVTKHQCGCEDVADQCPNRATRVFRRPDRRGVASCERHAIHVVGCDETSLEDYKAALVRGITWRVGPDNEALYDGD